MAIDFNDLKVQSYSRAPQPFPLAASVTPLTPDQRIDALRKYLEEELRRIQKSIDSLAYAANQVAIREPEPKSKGLIRYAKSPWNPLGTGDGWVYWNGSAWTAL